MALSSLDVPQANSLGTVRRIVAAVASGVRDAEQLVRLAHLSRRHTEYYLHAARILGFIGSGDTCPAVTAAGIELLMTAPHGSAECQAFDNGIRSGPLRPLAQVLKEATSSDQVAGKIVVPPALRPPRSCGV